MLEVSKNAKLNYLAKIVRLKNLKKHPNADKLQTVNIDFQSVITGMDAKENDLYVYFPIECCINKQFLSSTNSFRDSNLNEDKTKKGFFEKNGRVKAMKLRGERSMGYIVPLNEIEKFTNTENLSNYVDVEFDEINKIKLLEKYIVPIRETNTSKKQGKKPRISILVDGQVHLHIDTENLRKNAYKINPEDYISLTYKLHGTSFWVSNVLAKKKLSFIEKILKKLKLNIEDKEYDFIYGSRKVVKNEYETSKKEHYYETDLWGEIKEEIKDCIPKGYSVYGEYVGYTKNGKEIQKGYDYGCRIGEGKIFIYRITFTNADGMVNNLSTSQIKEYCEHYGLNYVPLIKQGKAKDIFKIKNDENWRENFIKKLEENYNDKKCYLCNNDVPEEGIVLRKESFFNFEAYKLKSWKFLEYESKLLDEGNEDIESLN